MQSYAKPQEAALKYDSVHIITTPEIACSDIWKRGGPFYTILCNFFLLERMFLWEPMRISLGVGILKILGYPSPSQATPMGWFQEGKSFLGLEAEESIEDLPDGLWRERDGTVDFTEEALDRGALLNCWFVLNFQISRDGGNGKRSLM